MSNVVGSTVDSIDDDLPFLSLESAEQGQRQRALSSTRATDNADPLTSLDFETDTLEDRLEVRTVSSRVINKLQDSMCGPVVRRSSIRNDGVGMRFGVADYVRHQGLAPAGVDRGMAGLARSGACVGLGEEAGRTDQQQS